VSVTTRPDEHGRFGAYGGRYAPEVLIPALDELTAAWGARGHEVGYGIGIAVGEATLGQIGFEGRWDYAAIGPVANLAARLCSRATAGQVLVAERTVELVREEDRHHLERLEPAELKGFAHPIPIFRARIESAT